MDPRFNIDVYFGKTSKIEVLKTDPYKKKNYQEIRVLGEGEYGKVFLYRLKTSYVAIKKFDVNNFKTKTGAWRSFQKELCCLEKARGSSGKGHENVVKVKKAFQTSFEYCIAMEYCRYGDLSGIFINKAHYTEEDVRDVVIQCCRGLEYLLDKLFVHRDIKDANILVKSWEPIHVCITDFNLSKKVNNKYEKTSMNTTLVGTSFYEAPEVRNRFLRKTNEFYNHKIDIFALGVVAYELFNFGEINQPRPFVKKEYQSIAEEKLSLERYYKNANVCLQPLYTFRYTSIDAKAVLSKMLHPFFRKRIDYKDILNSAWAKKDYAIVAELEPIEYNLDQIIKENEEFNLDFDFYLKAIL